MTDTTTTTDATGTPSASGQAATPATAAPATPATDTTAPTGGTSTAAPAAASTTESAKPATPAPVVPEKYDLKLPEKSLLDPSVLERTAASAKARGLTNEQAQKELDAVAGEVAKYHETLLEQHKTKVSEWEQQSRNDKEIGGTAFAANAELSRRVVEKFATPEFAKILNDSGYGNHPELVRVFARIGRAIGEDRPGGSNPGGGAPKKNAEDVLYGGTPTT